MAGCAVTCSMARISCAAAFTNLIGETFFEPATENRLVRMMLSMKPAGLIVTGGIARTGPTVRLLRQSGVRTVQLWDGDRPDFEATVGPSHAEAGRTAAAAFLAVGLRRACHIGAELQPFFAQRSGWRALPERWWRPGAECRCLTDPDLPRTLEGGAALTERLVALGPLPEAIHYLNDAIAIGGLRSLLRAAVGVPDRVSVIGFNGTALRYAIRTRLTTIEVPLREVGERTAEAVVRASAEGGMPEIELVRFRRIAGTTVRGLAPDVG